MKPIYRSILLNAANNARAEADAFRVFPRHALELRRIAEAIEAVLVNTESDATADARRGEWLKEAEPAPASSSHSAGQPRRVP